MKSMTYCLPDEPPNPNSSVLFTVFDIVVQNLIIRARLRGFGGE